MQFGKFHTNYALENNNIHRTWNWKHKIYTLDKIAWLHIQHSISFTDFTSHVQQVFTYYYLSVHAFYQLLKRHQY
jgi:hypothetical protein